MASTNPQIRPEDATRLSPKIIGRPGEDNVVGMLVFQGARRRSISSVSDPETAAAIAEWRQRRDLSEPEQECFHAPDVTCMLLDGLARPAGYFPDAGSNVSCESIARMFLFPSGLQDIQSEEPFVIQAHYSLIALQGTHHLLICPVPHPDLPKIGGLVVVDLERRIMRARIERLRQQRQQEANLPEWLGRSRRLIRSLKNLRRPT